MRAAISVRQKGLDVCVVSKQSLGKASCTILSAGVFAVTQEGASPDQHLNRTLQAGRGINQRELVKAALKRKESRGAHFREDFPDQDDQNWRGHLQVNLSPDGQEQWRFHSIGFQQRGLVANRTVA